MPLWKVAELDKEGITVIPEIMIPLVSTAKELEITRSHAQEVVEDLLQRYQCSLDYKIGTMIEIPRAALKANEISKHADFLVLAPTTSHNSPTDFFVMIWVKFYRHT